MILYHFAPAHMVQSIISDGLTEGKFPRFENGTFTPIENVQWLTAEPDERKQSWATSILIPYSRTAYRLTIDIPATRHKKLIKAIDYIKGMDSESQSVVTDWDGSDKWYVYLGKIPPKWIVGIKKVGAGSRSDRP